MRKLQSGSNMIEIIKVMSEYNDIAAEIVLRLLLDNNIKGTIPLIYLDIMDIRGEKLAKLFRDCCNENWDLFLKTITILRMGGFTDLEIATNLTLLKPIPFASDIKDKKLFKTDFDFVVYCNSLRETFLKELYAVTTSFEKSPSYIKK